MRGSDGGNRVRDTRGLRVGEGDEDVREGRKVKMRKIGREREVQSRHSRIDWLRQKGLILFSRN